MPSPRLANLLEFLAEREVDVIVVGMTAGILRGAPVTTVDLEIVHRRTPENVRRLTAALGDLDAVYRHDARGLRPKEFHLSRHLCGASGKNGQSRPAIREVVLQRLVVGEGELVLLHVRCGGSRTPT